MDAPRRGPLWRRAARAGFPLSMPRQPIQHATPIHKLELVVNPQSGSQLFNGRIPPEVRDNIFYHALTEYTKTESESQYDADTNYTRPGYTGKRAVSTSLLLTCRRVYLETYHLPMIMKEHVFWHHRSPPLSNREERFYFTRMAPWQLEFVKEIHIFTQLFWLEQTFPGVAQTQKPYMDGIEKLKITIRRGDWWYNEDNHLLYINPQQGGGTYVEMTRDWNKEKAGEIILWKENAWGAAFSKMASLKELVIEMETSEDKVPEHC